MGAGAVPTRKARGAFFTPPEIVAYLVEWAIRSPSDSVLEPSCGDAAFLLPAAQRLRELASAEDVTETGRLVGVEISSEDLSAARSLLESRGFSPELVRGDFFDFPACQEFDAVVGNPPYVRYQTFSGEQRKKAQAAALAQGVRLQGLASSWAAFVVHAAACLKPAGRLALVLPAELLSVHYAAPVRRYLLQRFRDVRLVLFEERVFPGVTEEVVLLMAEGEGPTDHFEVLQGDNLSSLDSLTVRRWHPSDSGEKWIGALLEDEVLEAWQGLRTGGKFEPLLYWGESGIGIVTGNNDYFVLSAADVHRLGLGPRDYRRICPPGSRHLKGLAFSERTWERLVAGGARGFLFYPDPLRPSRAAERYIREGEASGVHRAYKCRIRNPWWLVPLLRPADLFLTYMNHGAVRFLVNRAGCLHLNSIHGVWLRQTRVDSGRDLLPLACLNSITLLGCELLGRSYGGGILKLEPTEADLLPVPAAAFLERHRDLIAKLKPLVAAKLRSGKVEEAVRLVDRELFIRAGRVRTRELERIREGRAIMRSRRMARGRGKA